MSRLCICAAALCAACVSAQLRAGLVEVQLLTHADNVGLLPEPKAQVGVSGDHLLRTSDDITGSTFNPNGCFSFNFMNPVGENPPDYPPGYAEGIHSMRGTMVLDIDLQSGGNVGIQSLAFDGIVSPGKYAYQHLVRPGDPACDGNHGPLNGAPNAGTYAASAASNWSFQASIDWYYDTPYGGTGGIDMTFADYAWNGFIIPVSELTPSGLASVTLDDPLGYFGGTSADFESWLLGQVATRLPQEATHLVFVQGEAHPAWTDSGMGMTTNGIVAETLIGYIVVPEPASLLLSMALVCIWRPRRS